MEGQGHLGVALAAAQVHIESVFHGNQILLVVKSAHLLDLVRECKHDVTGREGTRGVVVMGGVKHADREWGVSPIGRCWPTSVFQCHCRPRTVCTCCRSRPLDIYCMLVVLRSHFLATPDIEMDRIVCQREVR